MSIIFLVIGPAVSSVLEIGIIPLLLTNPTVGLSPTTLFFPEGDNIEPEVSEPIAATAKLAATETALPELEPPVSNSILP